MELTIFKDTCTWSYELEACHFGEIAILLGPVYILKKDD